jgi:linoleoyl-CoA desaturase
MWNIYGKTYDLTNFIERHPGGKYILEKTKGLEDITTLFETYHAFSDIEKIHETLKKYEIKNEIIKEYTLDFTEYRKLVKIVKEKYPERNMIKANDEWIFNNSIIMAVLFASFFISYISNYMYIYKYIAQIIYSVCESCVLFNYLHDSSHYGVSVYPNVNIILSKITNGYILWNSNIWFYHHIYYHHSYTGLHNDPDIILYNIHSFSYAIDIDNITNNTIQLHFISFFYGILPGQFLGQAITYIFLQLTGQYSNSVSMPKINYYDFVDILLCVLKLYILYTGGCIQLILHFLTLNMLYFINVYPNHSLYEAKIENKYEGDNWARQQICHSSNFLMDNLLWTRIFGGINYQIEHHLFPNMSNIHYPEVSKIVRAYCRENSIPYVNKESLYEAYKSFEKYVNY